MSDTITPQGRSLPEAAGLLRSEAGDIPGSAGPAFGAMLARRRWYVIGAATLALVVGLVWCGTAPPTFEATGRLVVTQNQSESLPVQTRDQDHADYLETHAAIIHSDLILNRALQALGRIPEGHDNAPPQLIKSILKRLVVEREERDAQVLALSYRSADPADAQQLLAAVVQSYRQFLTEQQQDVAKELLSLIRQAKDELQAELHQKEQDYIAFRDKNAIIPVGRDGTSAALLRLQLLEQSLAQASVRKLQADVRLKALRQTFAQGTAQLQQDPLGWGPLPLPQPMRPGNTLVVPNTTSEQLTDEFLRRRLVELQLDQTRLEQSYGPGWPDLQALGREVQLAKQAIAVHSERQVQMLLLAADQEYRQAYSEEAQLQKAIDSERRGVLKTNRQQTEDETYRADIQRLRALYDATVGRLSDLDLASGFATITAQLIESPTVPTQPVEPNPLKILPLSLLLGLLLGIGAASLAETFDKSFRSADEVKQVLGLTVLGYVPQIRYGGGLRSATGRALVSYLAPRRREAEAYRSVATALIFQARLLGARVIAVTSPSAGEGKTTLTTNLAICLAQTGARVLLVDGDFRNPQLHRFFGGLDGSPGFSKVLSGGEPAAAIHASEVPGLDIMPSGEFPDNLSELLTADRLTAILDQLRERYQYVLVDSSPLLAVADASLLAAKVDAVLLTVRMAVSGRPQSRRAREILDSVGARLLGVVVGGISPRQPAYGSDTYPYHQDEPAEAVGTET